ncbi:MAG: flagellar protein export ATPase FliI [Parvularculaceae bacterium]|nr:flagellar protein export ATPase FliI [Parvularculaceae bacterium]
MTAGPASIDDARATLRRFGPVAVSGAVDSVSDLAIRVEDRLGALEVGARVEIETAAGGLAAEVVSLARGAAVCLPFGGVGGVKRGARAEFNSAAACVSPSRAWLGRVVNALGAPVDGKGPIAAGRRPRNLRASPPQAALRERLGPPVEFGVRALDAFCQARVGQRLGIFSGSGVGKSALLSMIARNTRCDVAVIALIGERGREVREFIEESLGEAGLARSVVIAATSDEPAMMRREAAYLAMTVAEHFRDEGAHVLCLMDSLTRVAAAQREIGLAAGEPPTAKGYTPSVFSLLPKLLERAGSGLAGAGAVTGVFTVLVEGDDHDEPIADAARAILDGHVVLDRRIAERGRFPAIDILRSVSRTTLGVPETGLVETVRRARALAAVYEDMREMIRIGAYKRGASPEVERAIEFHAALESFLAQARDECASAADAEETLARLTASHYGSEAA